MAQGFITPGSAVGVRGGGSHVVVSVLLTGNGRSGTLLTVNDAGEYGVWHVDKSGNVENLYVGVEEKARGVFRGTVASAMR